MTVDNAIQRMNEIQREIVSIKTRRGRGFEEPAQKRAWEHRLERLRTEKRQFDRAIERHYRLAATIARDSFRDGASEVGTDFGTFSSAEAMEAALVDRPLEELSA